MNILSYELVPEQELLAKLKKTRLKGFGGVEVYKDASFVLEREMKTDLLVPTQRYVLMPSVETVLDLADSFLSLGVDIFGLNGALLFWMEGMDPRKDLPIPFLPPIVEVSNEPGGRVVNLINDGMHRVYAARKLGRPINVVLIRDVPVEYPYYAYALRNGWEDVSELQELPDVFQKKKYRNPENYKALFRQFNEVFPGVQAERKKSNPAHMRE